MKIITVKSGAAVWQETWDSLEHFNDAQKKLKLDREAVSVRDATAEEVERHNAENCAADYYARHGTAGEF